MTIAGMLAAIGNKTEMPRQNIRIYLITGWKGSPQYNPGNGDTSQNIAGEKTPQRSWLARSFLVTSGLLQAALASYIITFAYGCYPMITNPLSRWGDSTPRAWIAALLVCVLAVPPAVGQSPGAGPETPQGQHLTIVIVEGEGAINNIRQRTAREPIVEVQDENHRPVAGAVVAFTVVPSNGGAGASFVGNAQTTQVLTDQSGRAVASGFHPNGHAGQVQIRVTASSNGRLGSATITQNNVAAGAAAGAGGLISLKLLLILGVAAGAAAAGGAYAATHSGSSHSAVTTTAPTTISPGAPTVGAP